MRVLYAVLSDVYDFVGGGLACLCSYARYCSCGPLKGLSAQGEADAIANWDFLPGTRVWFRVVCVPQARRCG
jgi:hypothetical protein